MSLFDKPKVPVSIPATRLMEAVFEKIKPLGAKETMSQRQKDILLGKVLGYDPNAIIQIKSGRCAITPRLILAVYDCTGWPIERIRRLIKEDKT
jgi:hypothetical protein